MGDLLGENVALVQKDKLYRCLDRLLPHKRDFFSDLKERWHTLFNVSFDILLYDLTSTYFESDPPEQEGLRHFGYRGPVRQERAGMGDGPWYPHGGDAGPDAHPSDAGPLPVGTPKGRLTKLEKAFIGKPWAEARESVQVKLLSQGEELYILAQSDGRRHKERAMRQRKLKRLWQRLKDLQQQTLTRDQLLIKLGGAKRDAGRAYSLVTIDVSKQDSDIDQCRFSFTLNKAKLRIKRRHEGRYLLRSNLTDDDPAKLWQYYMQLTEVEQAFKELKHDLQVRPIHHQKDERIEAHIFVAFVAYCLQVTLKQRLRRVAPGLTPRAALEKFAGMQMVDVHLPTTDGNELVLSRVTEPEKDQQLLLQQLKLQLPEQPPPKITCRPTRTAALA